MKLKISLLIVLFFSSLICLSQGNTIVGTFKASGCNEKVLALYKYNSPFSKELIEKKKGDNGVFNFRRNNTEIDTYLLMDTESEMALLFIWDNDLFIDLNCNNIDESIVINSPQTSELRKTDKLKYDLYILPLIKLDSLISQCKITNKLNKENICNKIILERATLGNENRKLFDEFIMNYIKNNPDSFVSLYYLTFGGDRFVPEKKNIEAFGFLSERLKMHSRSKIYIR